MRDELSSYVLSNKTGQIGSNDFHSAFQVPLDLFSEFEHPQGLFAQLVKTGDIKVTDLLTH